MKSKKTFTIITISSLFITIFFFISTYVISNSLDKNNIEPTKAVDTTNKTLSKELSLLKNYKEDTDLFLCNKTILLPESYTPKDIVYSNLPFLSYIETTSLNKNVAQMARLMFDEAKKSNISLLGASGYRSHTVQTNLFNSRVKEVGRENALKYSAPPGGSEHETGYAIDILSSDYGILDSGFENTPAFKWLKANSHKFGFILRYPKEKESITGYSYEPWHYRYVGVSNAKLIKDSGLCLEEYLAKIDEKIKFIELTLEEDSNENN